MSYPAFRPFPGWGTPAVSVGCPFALSARGTSNPGSPPGMELKPAFHPQPSTAHRSQGDDGRLRFADGRLPPGFSTDMGERPESPFKKPLPDNFTVCRIAFNAGNDNRLPAVPKLFSEMNCHLYVIVPPVQSLGHLANRGGLHGFDDFRLSAGSGQPDRARKRYHRPETATGSPSFCYPPVFVTIARSTPDQVSVGIAGGLTSENAEDDLLPHLSAGGQKIV